MSRGENADRDGRRARGKRESVGSSLEPCARALRLWREPDRCPERRRFVQNAAGDDRSDRPDVVNVGEWILVEDRKVRAGSGLRGDAT